MSTYSVQESFDRVVNFSLINGLKVVHF